MLQLQHTETSCNHKARATYTVPVSRASALHCNTLQHTTTCCNYNTLWHPATTKHEPCNIAPVSRASAIHCNTLQHTTTHCNYNTFGHMAPVSSAKWQISKCSSIVVVCSKFNSELTFQCFAFLKSLCENFLSREEEVHAMAPASRVWWKISAKEPHIQWLFCGKRPAT